MRDDRRHGFGIIGCGVIAPFHANAIGELPGARLVAVADAVPERARDMASAYGAEAVEIDALLQRPDIEVVCICVPSGMHADIGARVAAEGKHVVVEKPIEVTLVATDRLIAACPESGVTLSVISQHRWDRGVRELKELVEGGRLGRLVLGGAIVKWYRTQDYYASGTWRGTRRLDGGGALMNQGIHYVDLLQWMIGPVERVFARCRTSAHDAIEVEDIALAVLSFASGAVGVVECSTAVYPGFSERLEVTATGGTVIVEAGAMRVREMKDEKVETSAYGANAENAAAVSSAPEVPYLGHREQLREVLEAIEAGRAPAIDGAEARKPLEIILAAYESGRTGRDVDLPLRG
ncbi:MAG TPA: Gfo/Idh/MocA family oxidoreductase [Candidatus Dormibacteraeota bacterium]|nr:Gfo/Idh/MocA family oxidoreductase [Candidatus Dormibacteraeota bacterium]